jgi:two-component system, OmpR family, alkaline phosphatase synthesis response regulator PhoP
MSNNDIKILVVDDEQDIVEFLSYNLKKEGFSVFTAYNGLEALKEAQRVSPHLVILDIMMPGMDGIETCEKLRENPVNENMMIVFLTARSEDYSQIAGFAAGADDYVNKPVKPKVLVSRIKALLRRYGAKPLNQNENDHILQFNELSIDPERFLVFREGKEIVLPRKEFRLLQLLTSKPSRVFTRDEIFDQLWGTDVYVGDRTIDVYVRKLREKIGDERIVTIKGVGYKFEITKKHDLEEIA